MLSSTGLRFVHGDGVQTPRLADAVRVI